MKRLTWVPVIVSALLLTVAIPTLGASVLGLGGDADAGAATFQELVQQTEAGLGIESIGSTADQAFYGDDYGFGPSCGASMDSSAF
jgi:hypothetical protein